MFQASLLNGTDHDKAVETLSKILRCARKKGVMEGTSLVLKDVHVEHISEQYRAVEEKLARDIALSRCRDDDGGDFKDGPTSALIGKNTQSSATTGRQLTMLTLSEPTQPIEQSAKASEKLRERVLSEQSLNAHGLSLRQLVDTRKRHVDELRDFSHEPMKEKCALCGEKMFKGCITAQCHALVCGFCMVHATTPPAGNNIQCCDRTCSIQDTLKSNVKTSFDREPTKVAYDFKASHPRIKPVLDLVLAKVNEGRKVVIYTEHCDLMQFLRKAIGKVLKSGEEVVIASSGSASKSKSKEEKKEVGDNVRRFQQDEQVKVCLIGEDGVVGLDFSAGSVLILPHPAKPSVNRAQVSSTLGPASDSPNLATLCRCGLTGRGHGGSSGADCGAWGSSKTRWRSTPSPLQGPSTRLSRR